jgi:4-hydroxy-4-methyl-2-oxoglutarate aldolase
VSESTVYLKVNRVIGAVCRKAAEASVADLHEAMGTAGRQALMSSRMRPISDGIRIAGPAVTAFCWPGDNLMMHRALYLAEPGDVLVVVCDSDSGAQWGDLAATYAKQKGLAGVVVHGAIRDVDQLRRLGSAVWSTTISPIHPDKRGHGSVNAPVICDGVTVNPGDLVVADGDGVLCVPKSLAGEVVDAALARMRKEDEAAATVRAGAAVWELSGAAASYAAMTGVREIDAAFDDPAGTAAD